MDGMRFGVDSKSEAGLLKKFTALKASGASARDMGQAALDYTHHLEQALGIAPHINWLKVAVAVGSGKLINGAFQRGLFSHGHADEAIEYGLRRGASPLLLCKVGIAAVAAEYEAKHAEQDYTRRTPQTGTFYRRAETLLCYKLMQDWDGPLRRADLRTTMKAIRKAARTGKFSGLDAIARLRKQMVTAPAPTLAWQTARITSDAPTVRG